MRCATHVSVLDRLIPFAEAARLLGVAKRTLERLVAAHLFPEPVKFGAKRFYAESVLIEQINRIKGGRSWDG